MHSFSWRVVAADPEQATLEVEYSHEQFGLIRLNIQAPGAADGLETIVRQSAPTGMWDRKAAPRDSLQSMVGLNGATITVDAAQPAMSPAIVVEKARV